MNARTVPVVWSTTHGFRLNTQTHVHTHTRTHTRTHMHACVPACARVCLSLMRIRMKRTNRRTNLSGAKYTNMGRCITLRLVYFVHIAPGWFRPVGRVVNRVRSSLLPVYLESSYRRGLVYDHHLKLMVIKSLLNDLIEVLNGM